LISQATLGIYGDSCEGVHSDTIQRYYGTHGQEQIRRDGQTGAGHPGDEDDIEDQAILRRVEEDQEQHIRHAAVEVPGIGSPFITQHDEDQFFSTVNQIATEGIIPEGYDLLPDEQDDNDMSMVEVLQFGRRGMKSITVSLSDTIWEARAALWCQASSVLSLFETEGYF